MNLKSSTLKNNRCLRQIRAFTLVEVVISSLLLAIIMLSVYSGLITAYSSIKSTREDLRATQIMTQRLEAIRLCNWTTQLSNYPTTFQDYYNPNGVTNNTQGVTYICTLSTTDEATNIPDSASYKSQVHLVTVAITWTNMDGSATEVHNRQMQTLVAYNGLQNYIWGSLQ